MDGYINLLKPPGMSSSDAVLFVRKRLPRGTRVGHGGTLDPDAAGVLPVCVGRATRLFDYIVDKRKTYLAELTLGVTTDTQDASGEVVSSAEVNAGGDDVRALLPEFVGEIEQLPPAFSALKRGGKPMYELARAGKAVELEPRRVTVYAAKYLRQSGERAHLIRIECGKGVYIRTICHDIGQKLGCGGHMSFLLRERAGYFALSDALTLEQIEQNGLDESSLAPMDAPLGHIARADVDARYLRAARNGNPVPVANAPENEPLRVYVGGRFAGIGYAAGGLARFSAMLLDDSGDQS